MEYGVHVEGVPENDDVDHQPQRTQLVLLAFVVALTQLTPADREKQFEPDCGDLREREMLRERTKSGLYTARAQGRTLGRPAKLNVHQKQEIVRLVDSGQQSAAEAARLFDVHPATVSRLLGRNR